MAKKQKVILSKEQKAILNDLKAQLWNNFEFIRYVRREGNTVKFYAGSYKMDMQKEALDEYAKTGYGYFPKQQMERGWHPMGVEMDLEPYKQFIDGLAIPGLTTEIVWSCPYITPQPELIATLNV